MFEDVGLTQDPLNSWIEFIVDKSQVAQKSQAVLHLIFALGAVMGTKISWQVWNIRKEIILEVCDDMHLELSHVAVGISSMETDDCGAFGAFKIGIFSRIIFSG